MNIIKNKDKVIVEEVSGNQIKVGIDKKQKAHLDTFEEQLEKQSEYELS